MTSGKKTIKDEIIEFAKGRYYFRFDELRQSLVNQHSGLSNDTLKKTLYLLKKAGGIFDAGRGWYSTIAQECRLDKAPVQEMEQLIKRSFPFLDFRCWSTLQLRDYFHHMPNWFVSFVYSDIDSLQAVKDLLTDHNYNTYLNPLKQEARKFIELREKTVILRPLVVYRSARSMPALEPEKAIVDLYLETELTNLLDREEYRRLFLALIRSCRINVAAMLDYARNRKVSDPIRNIIEEVNSTKAP